MRNRKVIKVIAVFLAVNLLVEISAPLTVYALTGGPSQPEVQSFEPVGTTEMVDLFSGDFVYNIPLMDVGGYPINLSYHSGISMDQEASWVGLGWNINAGVINRNMRGLPDDYDGDEVTQKTSIRPNRTYGLKPGLSLELIGFEMNKITGEIERDDNGNAIRKVMKTLIPKLPLGIYYNNYRGLGWEADFKFDLGKKAGCTFAVGIGFNSQQGISMDPQLNFNYTIRKEEKNQKKIEGNVTVGMGYNSIAGLTALTVANKEGHGPKKGNWRETNFGGVASSTSFSFATPGSVPQISIPTSNFSLSLEADIGLAFAGAHPNLKFNGYYTSQFQVSKEKKVPAYGYLFAHDGAAVEDGNALMDFNREKDMPYMKHATTQLPVTNFTYDIYSVSGQGTGGSFRPHRSDVGTLFDEKILTADIPPIDLGLEFGVGNGFHFGANPAIQFTYSRSGKWNRENWTKDELLFKGPNMTNKYYEPAYFKMGGEMVCNDPSQAEDLFYNKFRPDGSVAKKEEPVAIQLKNVLADGFINQHETKGAINNQMDRENDRDTRNQPLGYLTAKEAALFGLDKNIKKYPRNQSPLAGSGSVTEESRIGGDKNAKEHHMSEMTVVNKDGSRYIYGIPAYNVKQVDKVFNVNGNGDIRYGQITYDASNPNPDNTENNKKGINYYFNSTELPAYAHSYLLTGILSSDYVDVTGNGISDDDLGTAVKINYSKNSDLYNWRVPIGTNSANFSEGFKSDPTDNKANYTSGKKEIWYMHSIETKNYVAEFYLSPREDAFGVDNEDNGTITFQAGQASMKLDKIVLYNKQDRIKNQGNAVPIKTVHFEYNYELCPNVPNNSGKVLDKNGVTPQVYTAEQELEFNVNINKGKLTLKKVYFTYGNSKKGELNPYVFNYADPLFQNSDNRIRQAVTNPQTYVYNPYNPHYNLKGYDRWGNYKPNLWDVNKNTRTENGMLFGDSLTTTEFPYIDQNKAKADQYAAAWHLTKIDLPSGGVIKVGYEADDYAYVQDQHAMQMFKVIGASNSPNFIPSQQYSNKLYYRETGDIVDADNWIENQYLFFNLQETIEHSSNVDAKKILSDRYFKGIKQLYFSFMMDITNKGDFENVTGYTDIEEYGLVPTDQPVYSLGWVKLKLVGLKKDDGKKENMHPIAKASMTFARQNLPKKVFKGSDLNGNDENILHSLVGFGEQVLMMATGYYRTMRRANKSQVFIPNKSVIRLLSPTSKKLGGGSRVSFIKISDSWSAMAGGSDFDYGQTYKYTTMSREIKSDGSEVEISSGVAEYEPMIGNDENPLRQPIVFKSDHWASGIKNFFSPSETHYVETPIGESHFPGASVGYSEVTVQNLTRTNVTRNATGYTVHRYYTAKDYPVITRQTDIQRKSLGSKLLNMILTFNAIDFQAASQGYVIELNDMHGKPKEQVVYGEGQKGFISKIRYLYKTDKLEGKNHLYNRVTVIDKDGKVYENRDLGVEMDFYADMREGEDHTYSVDLKGNLGLLTVIFPFPWVMALPGFKSNHHRLRTAVTTKVIRRSGILERTEVYDENSLIVNENLAYDAATGEVLLSSTQNEFEDKVYSFQYPAHWEYDGMGQAYRNLKMKVELDGANFAITNGVIPVGLKPYLSPGDEVYVLSEKETDLLAMATNSATLSGLGFPTLNESKIEQKKYWVHQSGTDYVLIDRTGKLIRNIPDANTNSTTNKSYLIVIRSGRRNMQSVPIGTVTCLKNPIVDLPPNGKKLVFAGALDAAKILDAAAIEYSDEWAIFSCWQRFYKDGSGLTYVEPSPDLVPGNIANPYFIGVKGNWRPKKSYKYLTDRNSADLASTSAYARSQGVYSTYAPFWDWHPATNDFDPLNKNAWTWTSDITKYSPYGVELENVNPLNIYSAAIYGYNHSLPIGVGSNAKFQELGFDGFEDYDFYYRDYYQPAPHFNFLTSNATIDVTKEQKHTGKYSIKVLPTSEQVLYREVYKTPTCTTGASTEYKLKPTDVIGRFAPEASKKYFVSVWMKENVSSPVFKYSTANIYIETTGTGAQSVAMTAAGPIINGWQKMEGTITIPANATAFKIRLATGVNTTYFDDLRVHPDKASMKTFAYDPTSQKLLAELDENNYATFYEHDAEGNLIRVKKETYNGIMTLKETRQNLKK